MKSRTSGVALPFETNAGEARRARLAEDRDGPLGGDQRLVVGGDHHARALRGRSDEAPVRSAAAAPPPWVAQGLRVSQFWQ